MRVFYFFIVCGLLLRVLFLENMEWKYDQIWMFEKAMEVVNGGNIPLIGMKSGGGIVNPGLGVWIFSILGVFFRTPISMTFAIAVMNCFAIIIFIYWASRRFDKEIVLSIGALMSVSPLAILFSRSIWAQDLLPLFSVLFLICSFNRGEKIYAFCWGFIGAILGQIHMPGFFYAFGYFLMIVILDIKNKRKSKWGFWVLGSIVGTLLLLPWLIHLYQNPFETNAVDQYNSGTLDPKHILKFRFFTYMLLDGLGIHLKYTMKDEFWNFIKFPYNSYLVGVAHIGIISIFISSIVRFFKESKQWILKDYQLASWFGGGLILTLIGLKLHPHYIIVAFPFSYIFIINLIKYLGQRWVKVFITCQLIISLSFAIYVHQNNGISNGDYGKVYKEVILK